MTPLCQEIWPLSPVGRSQRNQNQTHGRQRSRRTRIQFVSSYFKYCETQSRQWRFYKLQTDVREGASWNHDFTRLRANFNQMLDAVQSSCWPPPPPSNKKLLWFLARVGTFRSWRTSCSLRLCCPSFALCRPYKYSPRIKRSPLAIWPPPSLTYHSAHSATAATCLTEQYSGTVTIWRATRGSTLREGPHWFVKNVCGWWKRRLWPSGALKKKGSWSMDSVILREETVRFQFSNAHFHREGRRLSEAFTSKMYRFLFAVEPPNKTVSLLAITVII